MEELYKAFWDYMMTKDADLVNDWKTKRDTAVDSAIAIAQEAVRQALAAAEEVQPTGFECPVCMETVDECPDNIVCSNGHNAACASCASNFRNTRCPVCRLSGTIPFQRVRYDRQSWENYTDWSAEIQRTMQRHQESMRRLAESRVSAAPTVTPTSSGNERQGGTHHGELPDGVWSRIGRLQVDERISVQMVNEYTNTRDSNGLHRNLVDVSVERPTTATLRFRINNTTLYGWRSGQVNELRFDMRVSTLQRRRYATSGEISHTVRRNGIGYRLAALV